MPMTGRRPAPRYDEARRKLLKWIAVLPPETVDLPYESELMGQLGVSRVALRHGLAALRALGMIETRRGIGSRILNRFPAAFSETPAAGRPLTGMRCAAVFNTTLPVAAVIPGYILRLKEKLREFDIRLRIVNTRLSAEASRPPEELAADLDGKFDWILLNSNGKGTERQELAELLRSGTARRMVYSPAPLTAGPALFGPECDQVTVNEYSAIRRTLETHFSDCDLAVLFSYPQCGSWAEPRAQLLRRFYAPRGATVAHLCNREIVEPPIRAGIESQLDRARRTVEPFLDRLVPRLLKARRPLLFGGNDRFAAAALTGLRNRGIKIPEQVEIVGFDDQPELRKLDISTFSVDDGELADLFVESLQRAVFTPDAPGVGRVVLARYQPRSTTRG